jgi:hypothetical protein
MFNPNMKFYVFVAIIYLYVLKTMFMTVITLLSAFLLLSVVATAAVYARPPMHVDPVIPATGENNNNGDQQQQQQQPQQVGKIPDYSRCSSGSSCAVRAPIDHNNGGGNDDLQKKIDKINKLFRSGSGSGKGGSGSTTQTTRIPATTTTTMTTTTTPKMPVSSPSSITTTTIPVQLQPTQIKMINETTATVTIPVCSSSGGAMAVAAMIPSSSVHPCLDSSNNQIIP